MRITWKNTFIRFLAVPGVVIGLVAPVELESSNQLKNDAVLPANGFALDLYDQLRSDAGENLFFSPYSIFSALLIVMEGARDDTAQQMGETLRFPEELERKGDRRWDTRPIHQSAAELNAYLAALPDTIGYSINLANALWVDQRFPLSGDYRSLMETIYGVTPQQADFLRSAESERIRINRWVSEMTAGMIEELLSEGSLSERTRLVITNAIHFKGKWQFEFDADRTEAAKFTREDGSSTEVSLMTREPFRCRYAEISPEGARVTPRYDAGLREWKKEPNPDGWQMLELPYGSGDVVMTIILPTRPDGLSLVEERLDTKATASWSSLLREHKVNVSLPRFKIESKFDLRQVLRALGMPAAFRPGGFTGLTAGPEADDLQISKVVHQAAVEVDEAGTEAAAATYIEVGVTSVGAPKPPIPVFRADRPFLFFIRHVESGMILFVGRVAAPDPPAN